MANQQTPLEKAAHGYSIEREWQTGRPSAATIRDLLYDAFTEGALWAVNNPVLTSDVTRMSERKVNNHAASER